MTIKKYDIWIEKKRDGNVVMKSFETVVILKEVQKKLEEFEKNKVTSEDEFYYDKEDEKTDTRFYIFRVEDWKKLKEELKCAMNVLKQGKG